MKLTAVGAVIAILVVSGCGGGGSGGGGGRGGSGGGTGGTAARVCVPGMSVACACTNGTQGAQVCAANGTMYGACTCSGGPGAAGSSGGAGAAGAGGSAGTAGTIGTGGTSGAAGSVGTGGTSGGAGAGGTSGGAGSSGSGGTGAAGSGGSNAGGTGGGNAGAGGNGDAGTTGSAGTGGAGTSGSAGNGGAGSGGSNAGSGGSSSAGTGGTGGAGGICQMAQIQFQPAIPTVYLVVDRSSSMFHCLTTTTSCVCSDNADTPWFTLKNAIEMVVTQLDAQVRFGFTTIYGTNPATGGMCPVMGGTLADNVAPAVNNAATIKAKYDGIASPSPAECTTIGKKLESPAMYAIRAVANTLTADTSPGDKYIIFITDGQEDFCDDSPEICASDSTVGAIQSAFTAGVRTIVFGLQSSQFNLPAGTLDAFANAGAGESTVASLAPGLGTVSIFDQCSGMSPWHADLVASGHPTTRGPTATVGTYAMTAGPTKPYKPNAADQNMLVNQLSTAITGVKSCTFDLNDINGQVITVDTTKLDQAHVKIDGVEVPLSATNGWNVDAAAPTELVLSGTACTTWRDPASRKIEFAFPCSAAN